MNAPVASPWLTVAEAVEYLRLPSRKALYDHVRKGHYKGHRPHTAAKGTLLFHRDELDAALGVGKKKA